MGRPRYAAFERETLAFLEELADNNNRDNCSSDIA